MYATVGSCLAEEKSHIKHEFVIFAPFENDTHINTLAMLAYFHADERYRLDIGSVVEIGEPWLNGSRCDHFLISLPYPIGPKFEWLETSYGCVQFLWAVPITKSEAEFKQANGLEALEAKFDEQAIDYLDPTRASVV